MKKRKKLVRLMFDYHHEITWFYDLKTGDITDSIDIIDDDGEIKRLNDEIYDLCDSFIIWDEDGIPQDFDSNKARANKTKMLDLLKKLNDRLDEINDGSYVVEDYLTENYSKL